MSSNPISLAPALDVRCSEQTGVFSRAQLLAAGGTQNDLRRLLRHRDAVAVCPGIYVNHTGPLTWHQRVWAGYLACPGSALAGNTAMAWAGLGQQSSVVELAIAHGRPVKSPEWVRLRQVVDLEARINASTEPRRIRLEEALIDVASRCSTQVGALAVLMDAVQSRRTTAARLRSTLEARSRLRYRTWLLDALSDLEVGAQSVLERAHFRRVERAHRLPHAQRQLRSQDTRVRYRDVEYPDQRLVVELDGALGHSAASDRWANLDRDLHAAGAGRLTVRLSWHQVEQAPCRTAAVIAEILQARGWSGHLVPCGPGCTAGR
jgi:very-short-patch-repair endonuclease